MLIAKPPAIPSSEITPQATYLNRRKFLAGAAIAGAAAATGVAFRDLADPALTAQANAKIDGLQKSPFSTTEKQTPYKDVTNLQQLLRILHRQIRAPPNWPKISSPVPGP